MPQDKSCWMCRYSFYLSPCHWVPPLKSYPAISMNQVCFEGGGVGVYWLTHTLNAALFCHGNLWLMFAHRSRWISGMGLTLPFLSHFLPQCEEILHRTNTANASRHKTWHRSPLGRMKILTSIQKQNNVIIVVICEGARHERVQCCDSDGSNHTGIYKDWEMLGRGAVAVGKNTHANSIRHSQPQQWERLKQLLNVPWN